jgi:hypothetical protein
MGQHDGAVFRDWREHVMIKFFALLLFPVIAFAIGSDTSIQNNLVIKKGKELRVEDTAGGQYFGLKANTSTTTYTLTMPAAQGSGNQSLVNDGSGNMSWSYPVVANIVDTESWTPSGSWTNTTYTGRKWYVGDRGCYDITATLTGVATGGNFTVDLPSGDVMAAAKLTSTQTSRSLDGNATYYDASAAFGENKIPASISYTDSNTVQVASLDEASGTAHYMDTIYSVASWPVTPAAGDVINLNFCVPLQGRTSGVQAITQSAFPASQMKWQQTNCIPERTASGFDRLTDSDCTYAGAEKIGSTYDASQTGAVLPIPYIPAGKYEFCTNGVIFAERGIVDTTCVFRIADVANNKFAGTVNLGNVTTGTGTRYQDGFCGIVEYTSPASNVLIELEAARAVGDGRCAAAAQNSGEGLTLSVKPISGVISANLKGLPVGVYQPTVTAASCPGWATTNINVVPYQLPDNSWAADIKVNGTFTSATTCYVSISGLTFANTTITPCAAFKDTPNNWSTAWAQTSSSEIRFVTGAADVSLNANCTAVPLASKPTFVP